MSDNIYIENKPMELLAPAGSYEAFKAAIENGADAVYLGGRSFSARAKAQNFDLEQLKEVVQYAHERQSMVYVTVNILIADQEFPELIEYLYNLYEIGVDALIIQDIGVADLIKNVLPQFECHASTQMTINNHWAVQHIEKLGFKRVVLAREVSAEEIKRISSQTKLDIEVFVHGALCVCYSGQCLMSSFIGGRSGNRGTCAQPCRRTYQFLNDSRKNLLADSKMGNYLLSPRDLNFVEAIRDLKDCGVYSLKIEGRLKRPEYVATVTRIYRHALDIVLIEDQGSKEVEFISEEEKRELLQIFNRDFSQGYFRGNPGAELMSYIRPNNRGIKIGKVNKIINKRLEIFLEEYLRVGDGIEIWTDHGHEGVTVGKIYLGKKETSEGRPGQLVKIGFIGQARPGDLVFKTYDERLMERARISYQEGKEQRKRPLKMHLKGEIGQPLTLEAWDGQYYIKVSSTVPAQKAHKHPLTYEIALKQLGRLGKTPFWLENLELSIEEGLMIPVSELNEMRRLATEGLLQELRNKNKRGFITESAYDQRVKEWQKGLEQQRQALSSNCSARTNGSNNANERITVAVSNLDAVESALKAGARRIAFGGERWRSRKGMNLKEIQEAVKLCKDFGAYSIWRLPRIISEEQSSWWYEILQKVMKWDNRPSIMVSNLGELEMIKTLDSHWPFQTDFSLNVFNEAALAYFLREGALSVTLSPELEHSQIKNLAQWPKTEVMVFGDIEMMVSEYCPIGSTLGGKKGHKCSIPCTKEPYFLRDRLKYDFPIETDMDCRMHLFNTKQLNLYKELWTLAKAGVSTIRLQLDRATPSQIRDTVRVFIEGWDHVLAGERIDETKAAEINAYLEEIYPEGFTKGHYFRGIL